uniref:Protein BEX1-like n=1 Tax=Heterorhabditis bacteriophora TaxID=37862 RepID=A0A1I7WUZ3_HETBA
MWTSFNTSSTTMTWTIPTWTTSAAQQMLKPPGPPQILQQLPPPAIFLVQQPNHRQGQGQWRMRGQGRWKNKGRGLQKINLLLRELVRLRDEVDRLRQNPEKEAMSKIVPTPQEHQTQGDEN